MGNLRSICVDKLYFDEDGNILPVKQTQGMSQDEHMPADAIWYGAEMLTPTGGAWLEQSDNSYIVGLEQVGAGISLTGIDGRDGGFAAFWIKHETAERWAKLRLTVNGRDESFINCLGPNGFAKLTVPLKPGKQNEISLSGGNGHVCVKGIGVEHI
jgi:hypothetical protein